MSSDDGNVILVQTFVVPEQAEGVFLPWWRAARHFYALQPGFVSATLHRSLDDKERFRFLNISEWSGSDQHTAAMRLFWTAVPRPAIPGFEMHPALYQVVENG